MRKIFFLAFTMVAILGSAQTFESAFDAVKNLGPGWNLGNTLDSHSSEANAGVRWWVEAKNNGNPTPNDYETAWGQPATTSELIHMFKEAGFNTIRVPVTWYPHLSDFQSATTDDGRKVSAWINNTNFTIDQAWMDRVKEVVGYVLNEGMYCILNTHHDSGAVKDAANPEHWLIGKLDSEDAAAQGLNRFSALWTKIANEFKDYGDHLIFEGYNEVLEDKYHWEGPTNKYSYGAINQYANAFVNAVRATGGNNASRNLILNTYAAKESEAAITAMTPPTGYTNASSDNHIIYEIHMYPNTNSYTSAFEEAFRLINSHFVGTLNAPCIIGEWGCYEQTQGDGANGVNMTEFKQMAYYLISRCKAEGVGAMLWMLLSDRDDRGVPQWSSNYVGLRDQIIKAWNNIDCKVKFDGSNTSNLKVNSGTSTAWANDAYFTVDNGGGITVGNDGISLNGKTVTINAPTGYQFGSIKVTTDNSSAVTIQSIEKASGAYFIPTTPLSSFTLSASSKITDISFQLNYIDDYAKDHPNQFVTVVGDFNDNCPTNYIADVSGTWRANEIYLSDAANYDLDKNVQASKFTFEREYIEEDAAYEYWQPMCVPVDVPLEVWTNFASRVLDYTGTTVDEGETKLVYTPVTGTLTANHPYIFMPTGSELSVSLDDGVSVSSASASQVAEGGYTLKGTYSTLTMATTDYALWQGAFMKPNGSGVSLKPFRVYLTTSSSSAPQRLSIVISDPDQTGVEDIAVDAQTDDCYYDLTGRRVAHPSKGIYIHQGKKIYLR